ncbi:MAG: hypothetical protein QOJ40_1700, partial [Verrucomicrobiota bacterium]
GMVVIQVTVGKVKVKPRISGKISTVLQMIIVLWILLQWREKWLKVWVFAAAIFTGVSTIFYIWDAVRQLSVHPASNAKKV